MCNEDRKHLVCIKNKQKGSKVCVMRIENTVCIKSTRKGLKAHVNEVIKRTNMSDSRWKTKNE
jgi:hypothetical protein